LDFDNVKPVYVQIAEGIEDDILSGVLGEGDQAYSQLILARALNVNPATAAKGINVLVGKGILVKQRGHSMVVAEGAPERLRRERLHSGFRARIGELMAEAGKLNLSREEIITAIREFDQRGEIDNE